MECWVDNLTFTISLHALVICSLLLLYSNRLLMESVSAVPHSLPYNSPRCLCLTEPGNVYRL